MSDIVLLIRLLYCYIVLFVSNIGDRNSDSFFSNIFLENIVNQTLIKISLVT